MRAVLHSFGHVRRRPARGLAQPPSSPDTGRAASRAAGRRRSRSRPRRARTSAAPRALDRVPTRPPAPLARGQVPLDQLVGELAEAHAGALQPPSAPGSPSSTASPLSTSCVRPASAAQGRPRGLARRPACRRSRRRARRACRSRYDLGRPGRRGARLAARSPSPPRAGSPLSSSATPARARSKRDPEPLEDRPALRASRMPGQRGRSPAAQAAGVRTTQVAEEQRGLAGRGLGRVGPVDHVLAHLDREVAADRARAPPRAGWSRRSPGGRP